MSKFDWYPRNPSKFLGGTMGMPFETKGAYSIVIDLIWDHDGKLPDDARYIAGVLACSVRRWNLIRADLLKREKLVVEGEFLRNPPADRMIARRVANGLLPASEKTRDLGIKTDVDSGKPKDNSEIISRSSRDKSDLLTPAPIENKDLAEGSLVRARGRESRARISESESESDKTLLGSPNDVLRPYELALGKPVNALTVQPWKWIEQLIEMRQAGIDLEEDLYSVVREMAAGGRLPDRLEIGPRVFRKLAERRAQARLLLPPGKKAADVPRAEITDTEWQAALAKFCFNGSWFPAVLGPAPTDPACRAPAPMRERFNAVWLRLGSRPFGVAIDGKPTEVVPDCFRDGGRCSPHDHLRFEAFEGFLVGKRDRNGAELKVASTAH